MDHTYIIAALIPLITHIVMSITALHTLTTHPRDTNHEPMVFYIVVNTLLATYVVVGICIVPLRIKGPLYGSLLAVFFASTELVGLIMAVSVDKSITLNFHLSFLPHALVATAALLLSAATTHKQQHA